MKMKYGVAILLAYLLAPFTVIARAMAPHGRDALNIAGTHDGPEVTRVSEEAIADANLLLTKGTAARQVLVCSATTRPLGTAYDEAAITTDVGVFLLGGGATRLMVAAKAIAVDAKVYTTADGLASDYPVSGCWLVGYALTAATAQGQELEVLTCDPVQQHLYTTVPVAAKALAIPLTNRTVSKTTGADAEALTLANGLFLGQRLQIFLAVDGGGDGTLTPTTKSGFSTIVLADKGDNVDLEWTASGWILTGSAGIAAPPVITLA